ncbi:circadian clock-controlled protein daywake-like [Nymphalis io]|uniref:circadian clock-controlled protein daywake-like n=1 Tax=Inachis io TaxID=171585 RepID=UPI002169621C|nr:circadian clock-controlled protein daywake-like [Nymphalis io]
MKSIIYYLTFLTQLSLLLAGPPVNFKCLIWDTPCLTGKALAVSTFIATAIPQLGTKALDTIFIDSVYINEDGLKFTMINTYVQGMKDVIIDNVSIDAASRVVRLLFHTNFKVMTSYKTDGYLFSMPFYGEGICTTRLTNVLIDMAIPFDIVKDAQGKDFMDLKNYQYVYDVVGGAQYYLDNLYNGDEQLSDSMQCLMNKNWRYLTVNFGKVFIDTVADSIYNTFRNYMLSMPLKDFDKC